MAPLREAIYCVCHSFAVAILAEEIAARAPLAIPHLNP